MGEILTALLTAPLAIFWEVATLVMVVLLVWTAKKPSARKWGGLFLLEAVMCISSVSMSFYYNSHAGEYGAFGNALISAGAGAAAFILIIATWLIWRTQKQEQ